MQQANPQQLSAKHLFISGKVQGVYFRQSLQQAAQQLGVSGWCRNLPDGRVEAFIQGPVVAIEALSRWAHQGPPQARVQQVLAQECSIDDGLIAAPCFQVRQG